MSHALPPRPPQLEICVVIIPSSSCFAGYSKQQCSSDGIPVCFWSVGFSKVCDANGHWYLADSGSDPWVVLLLTGHQWHLSSCHKATLYWNVLQFLQLAM